MRGKATCKHHVVRGKTPFRKARIKMRFCWKTIGRQRNNLTWPKKKRFCSPQGCSALFFLFLPPGDTNTRTVDLQAASGWLSLTRIYRPRSINNNGGATSRRTFLLLPPPPPRSRKGASENNASSSSSSFLPQSCIPMSLGLLHDARNKGEREETILHFSSTRKSRAEKKATTRHFPLP